MRRVLRTELGHTIYQQRKQTVEPVFGHTKHTDGSTASNAAAAPPRYRNGD